MQASLPDHLSAAAFALAAARRTGRADIVLDADAIGDLATAQALQWAAAAAMGEALAGYKIGATSAEAQHIIGCDGPFYGQMFKSGILPSGTSLKLPGGALGLECEFAFRLADDLPARPQPYSNSEVAAAVEICAPAIEVVARRTAGTGFAPLLLAVADMGLNGGFVHGAPIADWNDADLAVMSVVAFVDGTETNRGSGAAVLGHPVKALAWLANRLSAEGRGLTRGQWISTGTCLGVVPIRAGSQVRAEFGGRHVVEVSLSG